MSITTKQQRWLKGKAHHLKPVVTIGQHGLTDAVLREIEIALDAHELVKLKIAGSDRDERDALIQEIADRSNASLIQRIGNTATVFRRNPDKAHPMELPA